MYLYIQGRKLSNADIACPLTSVKTFSLGLAKLANRQWLTLAEIERERGLINYEYYVQLERHFLHYVNWIYKKIQSACKLIPFSWYILYAIARAGHLFASLEPGLIILNLIFDICWPVYALGSDKAACHNRLISRDFLSLRPAPLSVLAGSAWSVD